MNPTASAILGFLGGGVAAWAIGSFVTYWIRHPVISACLDENRGSYLPATVEEADDQGKRTGRTYQAKYLRLHVENTGLSSIKDCAGYITKITKSREGRTIASTQEVLFLGWSHRGTDPRSIPRGAFFHMDVVSLHLLKTSDGYPLVLSDLPTSLSSLFDRTAATYEFEILIAADNALPLRRTVKFKYDPQLKDLTFEPITKARFPWWTLWRRFRSWWEGRSERRVRAVQV